MAGKKAEKISRFQKTSIHDIIFISLYSPLLEEAKNITSILILTWRAREVQNVTEIDEIW